jgi:putative pyruvate formate lyase activating enzyme
VDRTVERSACRVGERAVVASFGPHFGEEDPLRGYGGSGTIFFAGCNLNCTYCQNADISQSARGQTVGTEQLSQIMLSLQERGCHNVNLVSPTHVTPHILDALHSAARRGLRLPLVWNTGGYDSLGTLALLEDVVDIYMPDMKYADEAVARRFSKVPHYPQVNQAAVREMHRQVGDLVVDEKGIARRGLLVRHLVLPEGLAGTAEIARFLAEEISPHTYINLMDQYRPCYRAHTLPPLDRPITRQEYREALEAARAAGLQRFDRRERRRSRW